MKLIVGLGNIGDEYNNTRHNMGFKVIDTYVKEKNISGFKEKFNGLYVKTKIFDEDVILLKPLEYMNLSGNVIYRFVKFYKIDISDILVICDDLDLPVGVIKLKYKGSCGGHNGLRNIEERLNTQEYKRFKIGISNDKSKDTKDYVLGKFSLEELKVIDQMLPSFVNIIDDFIALPFEKVMSKYN